MLTVFYAVIGAFSFFGHNGIKGVRAVITAIISYVLCKAVLSFSYSTKTLDMPDFNRKLNTVPVPRLGGVGFFVAFFISLALKWFFFGRASLTEAALMITGGLTLLLGSADDFFDLSPTVKLIFQIIISLIASAILCYGEPPLCVIIKAFYISLLINAFNFIDGLDGLCCGISISALLFFSLSELLILNTGMGISTLLLVFSLVGFLPLNAYPARLYMGDAGSQTLGISIAIFSLAFWSEGLYITSAFMLIPIADVILTVIRRISAGKSPFKPDKAHLHHKLLDLGLTHPQAVALLLAFSAFCSLLSLSAYLIFTA